MSILLTGVEEDLKSLPGTYIIKMTMTTGDARIQWSVEGEAFTDISDTTKTENSEFTMEISAGTVIKSLITGNAVVRLNLFRR